jgi:hypothetical protein
MNIFELKLIKLYVYYDIHTYTCTYELVCKRNFIKKQYLYILYIQSFDFVYVCTLRNK